VYSCLPTFILGFHGCDKSVAEKVLKDKDTLHPSSNTYDWLGNGIYFWENNPDRALQYAKEIQKHPERCKEKIKTPYVLGAVIDLGHCLNLLDSKYLQIVKESYQILRSFHLSKNIPLPQNKPIGNSDELLLRKLDCAVIQTTHGFNDLLVKKGKRSYSFDSVRGVFWEGEELYENAGFREKNHIQVCVRNPNCIKGYFRVKKPASDFRIP